jgi:tetratricopeptide (TPR) repeat protein
MAINPYALCPCGSGKKIKFCCGDLAGEMEKVLRMVEGDQPTAAVRHLEQLLTRHPGRTSLLDLKSTIELQIGQYDQARATVDEYLACDPESANAWARRSILMSLAGELTDAVDALQRSLHISAKPPYAPVSLTAIRLLGHAFSQSDEVIAAIAHFSLYCEVSSDDDLEGERELIRFMRERPLPELMKGPFQMARGPVDEAVRADFEAACLSARRGHWLQAAQQFQALRPRAASDSAVVYNLALLRGFVGDAAGMAAGLREFASGEVPHDDAVEALALAQLIETEQTPNANLIAGKEFTFPIDDLERVVERLSSDRRAPRMENPDQFWIIDDDQRRPLVVFYVLDRPSPRDWRGLSLDDVPRFLGVVGLFGRETTRPPRAVVRITQDAEVDSKLSAVRDLLEIGDAQPESEEERMSLTDLGNAVLYYSYVPAHAPVETRIGLFVESRVRAVLEMWPSLAQTVLGGKSPSDLVGDPAHQLDLEAAVLRLFERQVPRSVRPKVGVLWERLGLAPLPQSLDPRDIPAERLSFIRLCRVDAAKLSDDQLCKLALQAAIMNATPAIAHMGRELLHRTQLHGTVNLFAVCRASVAEAPDYETAMAFIEDARRLVSTEFIPTGIWDVFRFETAFDHMEEREIGELYLRAARSADRDERVAKVFVRVLVEHGLVSPDGRLRLPLPPHSRAASELDVPDSAQQERRIWTPDAEPAAHGKGKIWTPS